MCRCICYVGSRVEARGQPQVWFLWYQPPSSFFFRQALSHRPGWLAREPQLCSCLYVSNSVITSVHHLIQLVYMGSGSQTQVTMQTFFQISCFPQPSSYAQEKQSELFKGETETEETRPSQWEGRWVEQSIILYTYTDVHICMYV